MKPNPAPPPFPLAERFRRLPPYLSSVTDAKKRAAVAAGRDIIDLGIGDPDSPAPDFVCEALARHGRNPGTHRYFASVGPKEFRAAVAKWFRKRFGVELCPETEICPVIGSKEGLAHFPLAYLDPGDVALIPEPAYPEYQNGTMLAGGEPVFLPLLERNGFLPNLDAVKADDARRAKIIYANYPHNPTGAVAGEGFYRELLAFAGRHDLIVISDLAYSELGMEGPAPMSMLAVPGARERTIEFHSFSKTFNMAGWRVGFAAGSAELCGGLDALKHNLDASIFSAIQLAAAEALDRCEEFVPRQQAVYRRRRDLFCGGLEKLGWRVERPKATFYVWIPTPEGMSSADASARLLEEAEVLLTPGAGFGPSGEGYLRAALVQSEERLAEAVERIGRMKW